MRDALRPLPACARSALAFGDPAWWSDEGANGGGHYAISPLCGAFTQGCLVPFSGDRGNMDMIENDF